MEDVDIPFMKSGRNTFTPARFAYASANILELLRFQPKASGMMTTIPLLGSSPGGLVM